MPTPEPTVRVTRYEVTCLPPDDINTVACTVTVDWRGEDRWAVVHNGAYFDINGNKSWGVHWEDGREPTNAEELASYARAHEAWLNAHRFDRDTALGIAREQARVIFERFGTILTDLDGSGRSRTGANDA